MDFSDENPIFQRILTRTTYPREYTNVIILQ